MKRLGKNVPTYEGAAPSEAIAGRDAMQDASLWTCGYEEGAVGQWRSVEQAQKVCRRW